MNPNDAVPVTVSHQLPELERLTRSLIQHAARNSPAALSERLEEEWLAHLVTRRGAVSRLCFAIGCCWAMRVITRDYLASAAPASSAATGHAAIVLGHYGPSYYSRRTTIFFLIVCLHVFVIYAFATGFAQKVIEAIPGPIQVIPLPQPRTPELPPPLTEPRLGTTPPVIPQLVPSVEFPPDPITNSLDRQPPPPPSEPATSRIKTRVIGGPGPGFPNTVDYYPLPSRRFAEMGVATVRVCVNERGRLASAPIIAQSSGSARLDEAALRLARAGSGHYRSSTEDGVPVSSCYPFRIRFQLTE
jgi:periplasmic protein TonB